MGRKMGRKLPWRRRAFREDHKGHKKIDLDKVGSSSSDSDGENGRHGDTLDEVETSMMENTNIEAGDVNVSEEEDEEGADPFDGGSFHIGGLTIDDQPTVKTVKEAVVISDIGKSWAFEFNIIQDYIQAAATQLRQRKDGEGRGRGRV